MNRFRIRLLQLCIAMLSIVGSVCFAVQEIEIPEHRIRIRFSADEQTTAENVQKLLNHHLPRLTAFFNQPVDSIVIDLVSEAEGWDEYRERGAPEWAKGLYFPAEKLLVVNLTEHSTPLNRLESVIIHELVHACFYSTYGESHAPVWFNEGLAEYLSGGIFEMDPVLLANARAAGTLPALEELQDMHRFPRNKAQLAYVQSLSAVQFLFEQLGDNREPFLQTLKTQSWTVALAKHLNTDDIGFEIDWYEDVKNRYRWFVIFNLENLLWASGALLIILAFFWKLVRNRRKIRQWEREAKRFESPDSENSDPHVT